MTLSQPLPTEVGQLLSHQLAGEDEAESKQLVAGIESISLVESKVSGPRLRLYLTASSLEASRWIELAVQKRLDELQLNYIVRERAALVAAGEVLGI